MHISPKVKAYRSDFEETDFVLFWQKMMNYLKLITIFGKKIKIKILEREFDSKIVVYSKKYLKAKMKSYNGKINTNFDNNAIPKAGSHYICLSIILLDSVLRIGKNYYPQVSLEKCKYVVKEETVPMYIIDDIEISWDSDRENPCKENSDRENSKEKNLMNKTRKY